MAQETEKPPSITYGSTRESKAWIKTPDGTSVAVDQGITWKGVTVYLSLTAELVAVDDKTKETLWAKDVGAFWSRVTFVETARAGGKIWAVELRPGAGEREGGDRVQCHDLKTGEVLKDADAEKPPFGSPLKIRHVWSGESSRIGKGFIAIVSTPENLEKLRSRMFDGTHWADMGKYKGPDFSKEIVLFVSDGDSINCRGIGAHSAFMDDKRFLVRLSRATFQTIGEGVKTRPFGVFVLPRRDGLQVLLERNVQRYIGGPPIWKDAGKLELAKDPAKELEGVPEPDARAK
jgi:hypothetical protein